MRRMEIALGLAGGALLFLAYMGLDVLPILLLVGLAAFLAQNVRQGAAGKRYVAVGERRSPARVEFADIGGQETAKRELLEALEFVRAEAAVRELGIRPLRGILLVGPPGTGKTLLAKAAASYTDSAFIASAGSEFVEMYAGVGAQRVRGLFSSAREAARRESKRHAIVFIDELEVVGGKRGSHTSHLEYDQTLNQLLVEMDGLSMDDDVHILVIGATNRVDLLDPALMRPGRFDRIVQVDLPDARGREQILALHTRNKPLDGDVDLAELARQTFGFSGAHLESLANEAAILALREQRKAITQRHFLDAIDKVILGEKVERRPTQKELERVAVHEAGHAIVSELVTPGSVATATIAPRGQSLGYVRHNPTDDSYLATREHLEGQICIALAGAVAEELILGQRSTGALGDYSQATDLARRIVEAGLSRLGIIDRELISDQTLAEAEAELLRELEERVRVELAPLAGTVKAMAERLLATETVSGDELRALLGATCTAAG